MPTYEYECAKCKKNFDAFQSMKDAAYTICPKEKCRMKTWGKGKVKRLLGAGAGLIFKGSGFYITDYRSEGYKSASKNDSSKGDANAASPSADAGANKSPKPSESSSSSQGTSKDKKPPAKES
jgi:putative FmdB family regulatory protein